LGELEAKLKDNQWLGGAQPSDEDKKVAAEFKQCQAPNAATHPFTFAWYSLAGKFA